MKTVFLSLLLLSTIQSSEAQTAKQLNNRIDSLMKAFTAYKSSTAYLISVLRAADSVINLKNKSLSAYVLGLRNDSLVKTRKDSLQQDKINSMDARLKIMEKSPAGSQAIQIQTLSKSLAAQAKTMAFIQTQISGLMETMSSLDSATFSSDQFRVTDVTEHNKLIRIAAYEDILARLAAIEEMLIPPAEIDPARSILITPSHIQNANTLIGEPLNEGIYIETQTKGAVKYPLKIEPGAIILGDTLRSTQTTKFFETYHLNSKGKLVKNKKK